MSAPQKPWEAYPTVLNSNSGGSLSFPYTGGVQSTQQRQVHQVQLHTAPPPLPPRHPRTSSGSVLNNGTRSRMMHGYPMGSYMGSYGLGYATSYGSMGDYSPYGIPRRLPDDFETRFIQMAEESSAPAFQSIEAFVRSFSSVTMMLESTYQAMYMSFRAVLSVAENVARLRGLFKQFLTSFAVLKTVAWFYNRIRYLLGLISGRRLSEDAWKIAKEEVMNGAGAGGVQAAAGVPPRTVWPLVTFFGLMLGGPYLVFKFAGVPNPEQEWRPTEPGESTSCVALYDFETGHPGELAFRRGDTILVASDPNKRKKQGGWVLAAKSPGVAGPPTVGYIPVNRIGIPRPTSTTPNNDSSNFKVRLVAGGSTTQGAATPASATPTSASASATPPTPAVATNNIHQPDMGPVAPVEDDNDEQ